MDELYNRIKAEFENVIHEDFELNGLSLFSVGIMGKYLMVNIIETKRLPKYTIKEKNVGKKRGTN